MCELFNNIFFGVGKSNFTLIAISFYILLLIIVCT